MSAMAVPARLTQQVRVAGMSAMALAFFVAAAVVVAGPRDVPAAALNMPAPQTCPPPCVPHVFSAKEEAELAGGQSKGKLTLPAGDSAVEEAMKAATDANGQMTALAPGDRPINEDQFKLTRTVRPIVGHGGMPFISQWNQMHGDSEGDLQTHAHPQKKEVKNSASGFDSRRLQTRLRASSGTLAMGDSNGDGDRDDTDTLRGSIDNAQQSALSRGEDVFGQARALGQSALSSGEDEEAAKGASLTTALQSLSNLRLRAIVRLLLKSRAAKTGERYGHGVSLLRSILDGSRKQQEEKRQLEQSELMRVRKAMDELAYKATRRRRQSEEDEDAISALTKRLSGYSEDDANRVSLTDGQRSGSLEAGGTARLDGLYEFDASDIRPRHGESSSTDRLLQMLGARRHDPRKGDSQRHQGRAELRSESGSKTGAATKNLNSSNKAIVEELAQLAARSPASKH